LANWVMKEAVKQETEHFRLICATSMCGCRATAFYLTCMGWIIGLGSPVLVMAQLIGAS
jgi:hypothetical protein